MRVNRGFTLLEMLAAIALLAVCSAALLGAFGQSSRSLQQSQKATAIALAARSVMDELGEGRLQPGVSDGQWDDLVWTMHVRQLPSGNDSVNLYRLDMTVALGARKFDYSTIRARAAGSGLKP